MIAQAICKLCGRAYAFEESEADPPEVGYRVTDRWRAVLRARLIKSFLRDTSSDDADAAIVLPGDDGQSHRLTRIMIEQALPHCRIRVRKVCRLHLERGLSRGATAGLLDISPSTVVRDVRELLAIFLDVAGCL